MKQLLNYELKKIKKQLRVDQSYKVEIPADQKFGHYSTNLALQAAKHLKKNPLIIAEQIIKLLKQNRVINKYFKIRIAGAGFVNFLLKQQGFQTITSQILTYKKQYFTNRKLENKKILVEYGHPNPFKSFHVGHLRTLIIGECLARILENAGANIIRVNYQGDVGLHIAKFFYGYKQNPKSPKSLEQKVDYLADCYVIGSKAFQENPKARQKIQKLNKKIYQMHPEIKKDWLEKRQWSLDKFNQIFKRLNTKFDKHYFESEMHESGLKLCQKAYKKGILIKDRGCLIFKGEKYGLNNRVFVNKYGIPTYEGKELALAYREFTDFGQIDKAIHVVANEQINFFKVTFLVQKLLDERLFDDKQYHLSFGIVNLQGIKISSREGNIVQGESIINEAKKEIKKLLKSRKESLNQKKSEQISETVAVGAVKYSFLKVSPIKDIAFDLKQSVKMTGQSGPYLMYSYTRATNILRKAEHKDTINPEFSNYKFNAWEKKLIFTVSQLPDMLETIQKNYQLSVLAEYTYDLANNFSGFYDNCPVLNQDHMDNRKIRIALVKIFQLAMGKCLDLMGIKKLIQM
ncbi:MAG: arginine--tRNA ligase [Candidatus Moranbacteria bacterium]|nr:arginine--tRNA ligase [Candidatus Moranbacteria bacterium]